MDISISAEDIPKELIAEMKDYWGILDFSCYGERPWPPNCRTFLANFQENLGEGVEDVLCLATGNYIPTPVSKKASYRIRAVVLESTATLYSVEKLVVNYPKQQSQS